MERFMFWLQWKKRKRMRKCVGNCLVCRFFLFVDMMENFDV